MTMRLLACGTCGADVPHGRLSCPACGELLASVSGSLRDVAPVVTRPDDRPLVDALLDDDPDGGPLEAGPLEADPLEADPLEVHDGPVAEAEAEAADEDRAPADVDPGPDVVAASVEGPDEAPASPAWPSATPAWPSPAPAWPDRQPTPVAAAAAAAPPGAYLPPTVAPPPAPPAILGTAAVALPAGPAAPAREWAGPGGRQQRDASATTEGDPDVTARARVDEAIGWVAVGGGTIALLGFVIPWARTIIGSSGDGYIDQWGLAGPGHVLIALALGAILAGVLIPNRIPAWLRLGIPGLIVGAILIGLVWPYVLGPLGALPGAFLSLAGALTLVGAAIASIAVERHAARRPAV